MVNEKKLKEFLTELRAKNVPEREIEIFTKALPGFQESVNDMLSTPQFRQYIQMRKLHLIMEGGKMIDNLLEMGILEG